MSKETTLREQMIRGDRASVALEFCEEIFKGLADKAFTQFRECDPKDEESQRESKFYLAALDDVSDNIRRAMLTGENARKELVAETTKEGKSDGRAGSRTPGR